MTNDNPKNHPDPRPGLAASLEFAAGVASGVKPSQFADPTPCDEFDVATLMGHLVCIYRRLEMIGKRQDSEVVPLVVTEVDTSDVAAELAIRAASVSEIWSDDALLTDILLLPFGQLPGSIAAAMYTSELLTHAWDLAAATKQELDWPNELVFGTLMGMKMGLPAEPRGGEIPFGPVVEVGGDSSAIEQLVAWVGRNPGDWQ